MNPSEGLLEGSPDGPGALDGDDDHHVDGASDGHVLQCPVRLGLVWGAHLDCVHCRDEVRVPAQVELHLQPLQAGVHQEHQQQEAVDDGETAEELSEGGADIVPREDNDGDGVDEDAEDTEAGEEDALQ